MSNPTTTQGATAPFPGQLPGQREHHGSEVLHVEAQGHRQQVRIWRLDAVPGASRLPFSLKILLENLLRHEDGVSVTRADIDALATWDGQASHTEIAFRPARVLMQDFTGVPAVVDLAAMREAMVALGGDPARINPLVAAEMVIDHSVIADVFGRADAFTRNVELEYQRNRERYQFLRWGQSAFDQFRVVPPGTGIVHQVNIEHLARVIFQAPSSSSDGIAWAYPDTLVGTDSHTTMVNGLGVLGWGVGGIEAEAAMLGQPVSMLIPQVVGVRLTGALPPGTTATDLVLTMTQRLRQVGVVGQFVEFFGPGVGQVSLANRATIGNMSPEYGSTCAIFPIDEVSLDYLRLTGRPAGQVELVRAYCQAQGLWHDPHANPVYSQVVEVDLAQVQPCLAGPSRPQDRVPLDQAQQRFLASLPDFSASGAGVQASAAPPPAKSGRHASVDAAAADSFPASDPASLTQDGPIPDIDPDPGQAQPAVAGGRSTRPVALKLANGEQVSVDHGSVVIAAITSCTNTSNPSVMVAAALLAKNAVQRGLSRKPWVKTTLAPGSTVVMEYYQRSGLLPYLEKLGFYLVGYGCTTCIGNSGPLSAEISKAINDHDLAVCAVLSGNRNFEGRINPDVKMNYLASPALVVAYALAGTMDIDLTTQPLGTDKQGQPVFLADLWPSDEQVAQVISQTITAALYEQGYAQVFAGDATWQGLPTPAGDTFEWQPDSTYVRRPPYFLDMTATPGPLPQIANARVLLLLGDSVTTDHISPAGSIKPDSPAGRYLADCGVPRGEFNSYGSRRGNHEVMIRGTFANIRLRNLLVPGVQGGVSVNQLSGEQASVYEVAMAYQEAGVASVIVAGQEYGSGSSRDWAAKGTALLGVKAVIACSFERIHRSNLIGMGVLPLEFLAGQSAGSLGLTGLEQFTISGLADDPSSPTGLAQQVRVQAGPVEFTARVRIDTPGEAAYYRHGGILPFVLRGLAG